MEHPRKPTKMQMLNVKVWFAVFLFGGVSVLLAILDYMTIATILFWLFIIAFCVGIYTAGESLPNDYSGHSNKRDFVA